MFLSQVIDSTLKKLRVQTANLLTLGNLALGGFSILMTLEEQYHLALLLIFIAALADRLDGMVARKLNIESELSKQLDSMCDIISFGVAPAILLHQDVLSQFGSPGAFFTVFYIGCGALRLARFNLSENNGYFQGLPITVAGCLITLSYLLTSYLPAPFFMVMMMTLSLLMVSPFKLKKM